MSVDGADFSKAELTQAWQRACHVAYVMCLLPGHLDHKALLLSAVIQAGMEVDPRVAEAVAAAAAARLHRLPPNPSSLLQFLAILQAVRKVVKVDESAIAAGEAALLQLRQPNAGWGLEPGDDSRLPVTCAVLSYFKSHGHQPDRQEVVKTAGYWALDKWRGEMRDADGLPFKAALSIATGGMMLSQGHPLSNAQLAMLEETIQLLESAQLPTGAYSFLLKRSQERKYYHSVYHTARIVCDLSRGLSSLPAEQAERLKACVLRAVKFLLQTQLPSGTWPAHHNQTMVATQATAIQGLTQVRRTIPDHQR